MSPRVFLAKSPSLKEFQKVFLLLKEALPRLFPQAQPLREVDERLGSPYSFFLQEGETLLWVEVAFSPLTRETLTHYLAKAKQVQALFPAAKICGVFAAPDFEAELTQLVEWILIPIRLFRYREVVALENSPAEPALWIEELTVASSKKATPPETPPSPGPFQEAMPGGLESHWNRLTREELRDFIQFEIDFACKYK